MLRAKIDMASPNLNMRDPVMYRILHATHHRTGDEWCIYPMYDYAHGQSDSIEHVTHSMCTLEFADHQPLYRWFIEQLGIFPSQQIEFDRLNLTYTLLSKRKLLQLVQEKRVNGWDDPRMPTLSGLRRRGFTPEAIRAFCGAIGASRTNGTTDIEMLEHFQRDDLNRRARRAMAVLHPLKLVIDNYPEGKEEFVEVANNPEDPSAGTRQVPFSREIYIEHDDFREVPPPKYYRLSPGKGSSPAQRLLRHRAECRRKTRRATWLRCTAPMIRQAAAATRPTAARSSPPCTGSRPRTPSLPRFASTTSSSPSPIRTTFPKAATSSTISIPTRLKILTGAKLEPSLANAKLEDRFQFERVGYFCLDPDSTAE